MKKITALTLVIIMMFTLCACGGKPQVSGKATTETLKRDDIIQVVVTSHASWPYREDWKVWEYIEEGCGATLDVTAYPASDATTKYSLMFASPETLPDIMSGSWKPGNDKHVAQGAIIAFDDMAEYMPNYNAWLDSLSDEEYANKVTVCKSPDGKVYYSPVSGREMSQNVRAWMYRKDVFEKHNLAVPTTFDELYEVCKTLKEIYPDSYPLCVRTGLKAINTAGASWKPYWEAGIYYDYNEEKWNYGATEDVMLENLEFYRKMVAEDLMPADFMTISGTSWQELITTDRGFITIDYQTRIDFFNSLARSKNPEFDLHAMVPPVAKEGGVAKINKQNMDSFGIFIPNNLNEERIANAAKFVDWFYTDEAMELVSWGKEGETYEMVNGKKRYMTDESGAQANTLYGFGTYGAFTRMDPEAALAFESVDIAETRDMVAEHTVDYLNPTAWLSYADEEARIREEYGTAIDTYATEMISKFILGQKSLSKFDEFVATIEEMGVDKLLETYTSAYNKVK